MIGQTDSKNIPSQVCRLNLHTFSANFSELKSSSPPNLLFAFWMYVVMMVMVVMMMIMTNQAGAG